MEIINVDFDTQRYARVEHSDLSVRIIPPLYAGQMLWMGRDSQYRYDKRVPKDYWNKYDYLKSNGWDTGYHYDNDWHKDYWTEHGGIKTNDAIKQERKKEPTKANGFIQKELIHSS